MFKILPLFILFLLQSVLMAQAPVITQPPLEQTVTESQVAQFTVVATGSNLIYQWLKDGVPLVNGGRISGSSSATLTISGTQQLDAGWYSAVVSVSGFPDLKVSSDGVQLKVNPVTPPLPQITLHPLGQTVTEGQSVQFSVIATGSNLVYQWAKNGEALVDSVRVSGVSTATLSITGALKADEGGYSVVVTVTGFPELKTSSDVALLKVNLVTPSTPLITQPPALQVVTLGNNVNFTVTATGVNLAYQWAWDGELLIDGGRISGAATPSLTITGAQIVDQGLYSVIVREADYPSLWTGSDGALLFVVPAGEPLWKGPLTPLMVDLPTGRHFGIRFNRLRGMLGAGIHIQGSANLRNWIDATPSMVSHGSPEVSSDGIREAVTFCCPLPISHDNAAGLRFLRLALSDSRSPVFGAVNSVLGSIGAAVTLNVTTSGDPATGYDWYQGWNLVGQTNVPQFQISSLSPANAGTYRVVARNAYGSTTSAAFVVQVGGWTYGNWLTAMVGNGKTPSSPGYGRNQSLLNDGSSNILKYAFGTTPLKQVQSMLPQAKILSSGGQTHLGIEFIRLLTPSDVAMRIEASGNLVSWRDVTAEMVSASAAVPAADGLSERVIFRCPVALSQPEASAWRYLRVAVRDLNP